MSSSLWLKHDNKTSTSWYDLETDQEIKEPIRHHDDIASIQASIALIRLRLKSCLLAQPAMLQISHCSNRKYIRSSIPAFASLTQMSKHSEGK